MPNTYEFPDAKGIVVSGDIHGDYTQLIFKACICKKMTDTLIVVAGDCGFGFNKPGYYENVYNKCRERLAKANNWIVFVRGNHDNPAYFDGQQVNYERWKAVPDYSVLKACGHTILCVGGAVTMERTWREASPYHHFHPTNPFQPDLYWPAEVPVYDQAMLDVVTEACAVDTVITHTAPSFCEPKEKRTLWQWSAEDITLHRDVKKERKVMDGIYTFLKENGHPLEHWFYGHFHESWHSEIEGVQYNMLDVMQLQKLEPLQLITEEQKQQLMATTLTTGMNAWEFVQSRPQDAQPWVAQGILSCIEKGYRLDLLMIGWEIRSGQNFG